MIILKRLAGKLRRTPAGLGCCECPCPTTVAIWVDAVAGSLAKTGFGECEGWGDFGIAAPFHNGAGGYFAKIDDFGEGGQAFTNATTRYSFWRTLTVTVNGDDVTSAGGDVLECSGTLTMVCDAEEGQSFTGAVHVIRRDGSTDEVLDEFDVDETTFNDGSVDGGLLRALIETIELTNEFTTEQLVEQMLAALPAFDGSFELGEGDGTYAESYLEVPEDDDPTQAANVLKERYKFRFTPPLFGGYKITWNVDQYDRVEGEWVFSSSVPTEWTWPGTDPGVEQDSPAFDLDLTGESESNLVAVSGAVGVCL